MYDLVIENAKIYDGTGNPWFWANVGVAEGKIARITRLKLEGGRVIDGTGLCLCPGFIDAHGHMDGMLRSEPTQRAKLEQGVTTSIGGMCGESEAPRRDRAGRLVRFGEYLNEISALKTGADLALTVGAGAVREAVMGYAMEHPTPRQMEEMKALVREAMQAGALGLSFGLAYPPSCYFDAEEMAALCREVAAFDGLSAFHIRNEGDRFVESVEEILAVGRRSGSRIILSHHKAMRRENWGKTAVTLGMIDRAAQEGLEIFSDAHPYSAISAGLKAYIPQALQAMGLERLTARTATADGRAELAEKIRQALASGTAHYKSTDPQRAYVLCSPAHPEYNGRRLMELARENGMAFEDFLVLLLHEDGMRTAGMHVDIMGCEDINRVLKHPRVCLCTDSASILPGAAAHPRTLGSFPRFLGRMCLRGGLLPPETAIMKMTSLPARIYGFHHKGLIREGMDADLVLFDPEALCDHATAADYGAANTGLAFVLLRGHIVARDNRLADGTRGRVVTRET